MKYNYKDTNEYVTKSELKERGWTDSIIKNLKVKPDELKQNPRYKKASPMQLFLKTKIEEIEKTKEFQELYTKSKKRKESNKKAVETKKENLLSEISNIPIKIPILSKPELKQQAIDNYNALIQEKATRVFEYNVERADLILSRTIIDKKDLDTSFLNRIQVNFLRHNALHYENKLEEIVGKVGKSEAYTLLKNKILDAITLHYPELNNECKRQKISKEILLQVKIERKEIPKDEILKLLQEDKLESVIPGKIVKVKVYHHENAIVYYIPD